MHADQENRTRAVTMSSPGPVAMSSRWRLGTVAWFDGPKGFGFIQPVGDREAPVFVEHSSIDTPGYRVLVEGQQVLFRDRGGRPQAAAVRPITADLANSGDLANACGLANSGDFADAGDLANACGQESLR